MCFLMLVRHGGELTKQNQIEIDRKSQLTNIIYQKIVHQI